MSRLSTSFVLGYHGCETEVAERAIEGGVLKMSEETFDWLGPGTYFWENDARRGLEWATERTGKRKLKDPCVIGAVIDLGNCLDLVNRDDIELLTFAHNDLKSAAARAGLELPTNRSVTSGDSDEVLRELDCAVIKRLHELVDKAVANAPVDGVQGSVQPFDTVRGLFTEGGPAYEGAKFLKKTHIQIAVRNESSIKGFFWPRPYPEFGS